MLDPFTIIWGWLVDFYLSLVLPSLLQPGNIPAIKEKVGVYTFYSSEEAKAKIIVHPLYHELRSLLQVEWQLLQKYDVNSNLLCQMRASAARKNYMILVIPDAVLGNNSLQSIAELTEQGFNPILYSTPKVNPDAFPIIKQELEANKTISNRKLVSIVMKNLSGAAYTVTPRGPECWSVIARVPAPFLIPDNHLIEFYCENTTPFSGFDHVVPYYMLQKGYPWHLIRHSDVFYHAEYASGLGAPPPGMWYGDIMAAGEKFFSQFEIIWQGE